MSDLGYSSLSACTLIPDNSSYLSNTHYSSPRAMDSSTLGLMMLLSTLQYQAPYTSPTYSAAFSNVGKAAFMVSGGQAMQDKATAMAESGVKNGFHSIGVTDTELGIPLGIAKVVRDKKLTVKGPRFYNVKTDLTATQTGGSLGISYGW